MLRIFHEKDICNLFFFSIINTCTCTKYNNERSKQKYKHKIKGLRRTCEELLFYIYLSAERRADNYFFIFYILLENNQ